MTRIIRKNDPDFNFTIEGKAVGEIVFYKDKVYILTDSYWDLKRVNYQYTYVLKSFTLIRFYWFKLRKLYYELIQKIQTSNIR